MLEMQTVDSKVPFEKQTQHQRRLNRIRADLGLLADRPIISSSTPIAELRAKHEKMSPYRDELVALSGKETAAKRKPTKEDPRPPGPPMTKQDTEQLAKLRRMVASL